MSFSLLQVPVIHWFCIIGFLFLLFFFSNCCCRYDCQVDNLSCWQIQCFANKVFKQSFAGSWIFRVPYTIYAEDPPKCIRTLFLKSCWKDELRDRFLWGPTRDPYQSIWCVPAIFHCSSRILNDARKNRLLSKFRALCEDMVQVVISVTHNFARRTSGMVTQLNVFDNVTLREREKWPVQIRGCSPWSLRHRRKIQLLYLTLKT